MRLHRCRAQDAIRGEAHIVLELTDRSVRTLSEDAVLPAGVEPQEAEGSLEGSEDGAGREKQRECRKARSRL